VAICAALGKRRVESLIEAVGALSSEHRPPLLLLTPEGQRGDADLCRRFGVSAYLTLPLDERDFHDALAVLAGADMALALSQGVLVTRHFLREARRFAPVLAVAQDAKMRAWLQSEIESLGHRVVTLGFAEARQYIAASSDAPAVIVTCLDDKVGQPNELLRALRQTGKGAMATPPAIIALVDPNSDLAASLHGGAADVIMNTPLDMTALRLELIRQVRSRIRRPDSAVSHHRTLIDTQALTNRLESKSMVEALFRVFLAEGDNMTAHIRQAILDEDSDALLRSAHVMRSAVATLGVRSAVDLCARMETCGRRGDLGRAMTWLRRLERVISAIRVELTATQSNMRMTGSNA